MFLIVYNFNSIPVMLASSKKDAEDYIAKVLCEDSSKFTITEMDVYFPSRLHPLRDIFNEWDPVGVADRVSDEYNSYVRELVQILDECKNGSGPASYKAATTMEAINQFLNDVYEGCGGSFSIPQDVRMKLLDQILSLDVGKLMGKT